ncbi:16S rRNA (guanine(966)-N(2))-methyltransferase RsmD [Hoeflea prorocentri]|uniref:16S rRNA (Guanine(966)-N(2))-methyltransferase RsmD n=1 Tax=Hoeflea prorocentri TaxID=1922333 RepID=A0A9X3ZIB3_9HYPH|nr:16S rRNA (guanine(966)-N(2))-methyltransferase RsmD [Hoeflea prorocentri]MCY6382259.1 16S rRNA (guanine(966)-N(2))-methyltransferase RsmD [Hoeflea prorocentri]MDA5400059.1 16S rRNA (guanine(966)-N(2))-methyltransferase RsmD [Hoeflea prorocentri]
MRIVGGRFKGRALSTPRSQSIRPTTDRTREALFNILEHGFQDALEGSRILDLFAGTGALGLEALSRGGAFALFVEQSSQGRGLLRANIETLSVQGCTKVFRRDATKLGTVGSFTPFDLVFADPPYGRGLGELALASAAAGGWIAQGALVVLEERAAAEPAPGPAFTHIDTRAFGDTQMRFYRYQV